MKTLSKCLGVLLPVALVACSGGTGDEPAEQAEPVLEEPQRDEAVGSAGCSYGGYGDSDGYCIVSWCGSMEECVAIDCVNNDGSEEHEIYGCGVN